MDAFWEGFEKQAGVLHTTGKTFGHVFKTPGRVAREAGEVAGRTKKEYMKGWHSALTKAERKALAAKKAPKVKEPPKAKNPLWNKGTAIAAGAGAGLIGGLALGSGSKQPGYY